MHDRSGQHRELLTARTALPDAAFGRCPASEPSMQPAIARAPRARRSPREPAALPRDRRTGRRPGPRRELARPGSLRVALATRAVAGVGLVTAGDDHRRTLERASSSSRLERLRARDRFERVGDGRGCSCAARRWRSTVSIVARIARALAELVARRTLDAVLAQAARERIPAARLGARAARRGRTTA